MFYPTVCIQHSTNFSNGVTRLQITRINFSSSFRTFWGFNLSAGGDGGYILGSGGFILGGGGWWWAVARFFNSPFVSHFFTAMCQARIYFDGIIYMTALFI